MWCRRKNNRIKKKIEYLRFYFIILFTLTMWNVSYMYVYDDQLEHNVSINQYMSYELWIKWQSNMKKGQL